MIRPNTQSSSSLVAFAFLIATRIVSDWYFAGSPNTVVVSAAIYGLALVLGVYTKVFSQQVRVTLLLLLASALHSGMTDSSLLPAGVSMAVNLALFFSVQFLCGNRTQDQAITIARIVIGAVLFSAAFGLLGAILGRNLVPVPNVPSLNVFNGRLGGLIAFPQIASLVYVLTFLIVLNADSGLKIIRSKRMRLLTLALLLAGTWVTGTLSSFVGLAAALVFHYRRAILGIISRPRNLLLAGLLVLVAMASPAFKRLQDFAQNGTFDPNATQADNSFGWRLIQWRRSWEYAQDHLLLGRGPSSSQGVQYLDYLLPHSDLFRILIEFGLLGVLVGLVMVGRAWRKATRFSEKQSHTLGHELLVATVLTALGENVFDQGLVYVILAVYLGINVSIRNTSIARAQKDVVT